MDRQGGLGETGRKPNMLIGKCNFETPSYLSNKTTKPDTLYGHPQKLQTPGTCLCVGGCGMRHTLFRVGSTGSQREIKAVLWLLPVESRTPRCIPQHLQLKQAKSRPTIDLVGLPTP